MCCKNTIFTQVFIYFIVLKDFLMQIINDNWKNFFHH